ncbi:MULTISPECIES: hypothetical protein [unclassified Serinicoccus]|uniref:hypothetical protein n=1 Tax=unclassified Serinicoccus TaxID=2643101 RepID=UPI0038543E23
MTYVFSKAVAVATAGYALFAVARPQHLSDALGEKGAAADATHRTAYTYAARDLPISALTVLGRGELPAAGALLRLAGDLGDAVVLGLTGPDGKRGTLVAVPLAWGGITLGALALDRWRDGR